MVYKENLVCVIKHAGNILREKDGLVSLPFNSEYSLYFKNLNSRRASITISIDGDDVLDNSSLIIEGNSETELEGFLNGNIAKNKFKFIQKTKEIQKYRGDHIDDGMIRIEFAFEKRVSQEIISRRFDWSYNYNSPFCFRSPPYPDITYTSGGTGDDQHFGDTIRSYNCSSNVVQDSLCCNNQASEPIPDEGITVKGSEINQNFNYANIGELDSSQVIILRLCGEKVNGTKVKKSVTVKSKLACKTCGRKSKSSSKFCQNCGTFLE